MEGAACSLPVIAPRRRWWWWHRCLVPSGQKDPNRRARWRHGWMWVCPEIHPSSLRRPLRTVVQAVHRTGASNFNFNFKGKWGGNPQTRCSFLTCTWSSPNGVWQGEGNASVARSLQPPSLNHLPQDTPPPFPTTPRLRSVREALPQSRTVQLGAQETRSSTD